MTWIERVKKALWSAQAEYKFMHDNGVDPSRKYSWEDLAEFMYKRTQDALAAIPDEDPMEKLLRWLEKWRQRGLSSSSARAALAVEDIESVMDHIQKEFGYSLPPRRNNLWR